MRSSLICLICSFFAVSSSFAQEIKLCGNLAQGELVLGQIKNASKVKFHDKEYFVNENDEFLFALQRDEKTNSKDTKRD